MEITHITLDGLAPMHASPHVTFHMDQIPYMEYLAAPVTPYCVPKVLRDSESPLIAKLGLYPGTVACFGR